MPDVLFVAVSLILEHFMACSRCSTNISLQLVLGAVELVLHIYIAKIAGCWHLDLLPHKDSLLLGPATTWVSQLQGVVIEKNHSKLTRGGSKACFSHYLSGHFAAGCPQKW